MLYIGVRASKRSGSTTNFIVAGRNMPIWIGSATIIATWFGGGTRQRRRKSRRHDMATDQYQAELERRIALMEDAGNLGAKLEPRDWLWLLALGIALPLVFLIWGISL